MQNLSEQIRECYRHAEDCARRGNVELNPELRRDFLDLEQRWLKLARSYQVTEQVLTKHCEIRKAEERLSPSSA